MSLHTHFHAPRTTLSWRIQIEHKSGSLLLLFIYYYYYLCVNIKPPGHCFGFNLAWGWQYDWYISATTDPPKTLNFNVGEQNNKRWLEW